MNTQLFDLLVCQDTPVPFSLLDVRGCQAVFRRVAQPFLTEREEGTGSESCYCCMPERWESISITYDYARVIA